MEPRLLNVINSYCITFGFQGVTSSNTKLNWRDIWGDMVCKSSLGAFREGNKCAASKSSSSSVGR